MNVENELTTIVDHLEDLEARSIKAAREYYEAKYALVEAQQFAEEEIRKEAAGAGEKLVEARMSFLIAQNTTVWRAQNILATTETLYRTVQAELEVMKLRVAVLVALQGGHRD